MKKIVKVFSILLLCFGFMFGALGIAIAQDAGSDEFTLGEVTVTAQKRAQDSQKVALQMDVVSGEELSERGVVTLRDALRNVSAAFVQDAAKDLQIVIRGMTNNNMPGDSVNQVAVSIDGAYSNNFLTGQSGFYDMQRVEVLAGPQGTLHSRNTSGGIVNLISNDPSTDAFAGSASAGLGNYSYLTTQGMLNVPLSDLLAFRAAFNTSARDGYLTNGTMDDDTKSARFKLGYTPSDTLSAVLTYEYTKLGGLSGSGFVVSFEDEDDVDDPWTSTIPSWVYRQDRSSDRFSLNLNWTTPIGTLTLLPAYAEYLENNAQQDPLKVDGMGNPITGGGPPPPGAATVGWRQQIRGHQQKEKSVEVRMASTEDSFVQWILGYYYYDMEWTNPWSKDRAELDGAVWPDVFAWSVQENTSHSVFGNVTVPVTDSFRVTAGARYTTDDEYRYGYDSTGGRSGMDFYSTSGPYDDEHTDYKASVEYDVNENAMLWADYSTGYKMGFRGNPSQTVDSYQLGEKARFLDNRLQLNATLFYYDYENFQIQAGEHPDDPDYRGNGFGKADMSGIDISTEYIVTRQDRLNLSVAYLKADISSATIIYSNMFGDELPPVHLTDNLPKLNGAPELTITASYSHMFEFADGGSLTARIDPRYVSEKTLQFQPSDPNVGLDVDKLNTEPDHMMVDASLAYYSPDDTWSVNAYVKNLTNHAEKTGFYMNLEFMQIGPPRTYGATVSVKF